MKKQCGVRSAEKQYRAETQRRGEGKAKGSAVSRVWENCERRTAFTHFYSLHS